MGRAGVQDKFQAGACPDRSLKLNQEAIRQDKRDFCVISGYLCACLVVAAKADCDNPAELQVERALHSDRQPKRRRSRISAGESATSIHPTYSLSLDFVSSLMILFSSG